MAGDIVMIRTVDDLERHPVVARDAAVGRIAAPGVVGRDAQRVEDHPLCGGASACGAGDGEEVAADVDVGLGWVSAGAVDDATARRHTFDNCQPPHSSEHGGHYSRARCTV